MLPDCAPLQPLPAVSRPTGPTPSSPEDHTMTAYFWQARNPSLNAQIETAQSAITYHQHQLGLRSQHLAASAQHQLTHPATLLCAVSVGFIGGELSYCKTTSAVHNHVVSDLPRSSLRIALQLITTAYTFYTALPVVWLRQHHRYTPPRSTAMADAAGRRKEYSR